MAQYGGLIEWEDPARLSKQISVAMDSLQDELVKETNRNTELAYKDVRHNIEVGGVRRGSPTGDTRSPGGNILAAVDVLTKVNSRGRYEAEFGYIDNPPMWTVFQEHGTKARPGNMGIRELRAVADAYVTFRNRMTNTFSGAGLNVRGFGSR